MNYPISVDSFLLSMLTLIIGAVLIFDGFTMLKNGTLILSPSQRITLALCRFLKRKKDEATFLAQFSQPRRVKMQGIEALIIGTMAFILGVLSIIGWLKRVFNFY